MKYIYALSALALMALAVAISGTVEAGLVIPGGNNSNQALESFFNVTNTFTTLPHTPSGDPDGIAVQFVPQVIRVALSVFSIALVIAITYAGVLWVANRGDEENARKAAKTFVFAIIAAIVVSLAYALVFAVANLDL